MAPKNIQNRRGCFIIVGLIVLIAAVAAWLASETMALREPPPAANLPAPGDPTVD